KSVLQLLHLKRLRASLPLRQSRQEATEQVDPDEQLELLFRDVRRDSEPNAAQWEERATVFEDRLRRLDTKSHVTSSKRFNLSRLPWSAESGPRVAVLGFGVAAIVGMVATSTTELGPQLERGV